MPHAQPTHPGTARSRPGIETPQDRSQAPSRTSSLDSSGAASGVASGASHFRTRSRDSDFRESRFYSGQRSPSVESSASLQKVQTNLHQSRQHMQEVEQTMQAMRGALESSKELLTRSSLAHGDDVLTVSAANEKEPTSLEELARRLQSQQEALIAKLTQRWEQRFAALEQALSSGLEVATAATGSMNDRLTRFVSLAEVLEGAVERVIHSSKDIATLSRKVSQIEDDVACLAQELASDQKGRSEAVTLAEVDAACEELRRELGRRPVLSVEGEGSGSNGSSSLNSLSAALGEERSERLRLSAEQRRMAKQAEQLESRLQTAQEQLAQVARAQQEAGTSSPGAGTSRLALLAGRSRRVSGSGSRSLGSRLIGPIEEEEEDEDGNKAKAKGTATQLVQRRSLKGWEASEPPAAPESDGGIFSRILGR